MSLFLNVRFTSCLMCFFFFFNDTSTTEIYTLSLHDALPIRARSTIAWVVSSPGRVPNARPQSPLRSEEHTSELQLLAYLVCRLLLEKKKTFFNVISRLLNPTTIHTPSVISISPYNSSIKLDF